MITLGSQGYAGGLVLDSFERAVTWQPRAQSYSRVANPLRCASLYSESKNIAARPTRRLIAFLLAAIVFAGLIAVSIPDRRVRGWSLGTAYAAFFLLMWGLTIGPLNIIRRRPNPVHNPVRRDAGIAGGMMGIIHTVIGLQVHMGGNLARYFLPPPDLNSAARLFLAANWTGLISAVVLALLVVISNNASLRRLGLVVWKNLQRWAYAAAALAIGHGLAYQLLEKRPRILIAFLCATTLLVFLIQVAGWRVKRAAA
ncbi:MAG: hypothetical protein ABJC63_01420 [Gemmatimonadales bacterium]